MVYYRNEVVLDQCPIGVVLKYSDRTVRLGINTKTSLSDPSKLFLDELVDWIIQPPAKNDNDKLKKMQNIY